MKPSAKKNRSKAAASPAAPATLSRHPKGSVGASRLEALLLRTLRLDQVSDFLQAVLSLPAFCEPEAPKYGSLAEILEMLEALPRRKVHSAVGWITVAPCETTGVARPQEPSVSCHSPIPGCTDGDLQRWRELVLRRIAVECEEAEARVLRALVSRTLAKLLILDIDLKLVQREGAVDRAPWFTVAATPGADVHPYSPWTAAAGTGRDCTEAAVYLYAALAGAGWRWGAAADAGTPPTGVDGAHPSDRKAGAQQAAGGGFLYLRELAPGKVWDFGRLFLAGPAARALPERFGLPGEESDRGGSVATLSSTEAILALLRRHRLLHQGFVERQVYDDLDGVIDGVVANPVGLSGERAWLWVERQNGEPGEVSSQLRLSGSAVRVPWEQVIQRIHNLQAICSGGTVLIQDIDLVVPTGGDGLPFLLAATRSDTSGREALRVLGIDSEKRATVASRLLTGLVQSCGAISGGGSLHPREHRCFDLASTPALAWSVPAYNNEMVVDVGGHGLIPSLTITCRTTDNGIECFFLDLSGREIHLHFEIYDGGVLTASTRLALEQVVLAGGPCPLRIFSLRAETILEAVERGCAASADPLFLLRLDFGERLGGDDVDEGLGDRENVPGSIGADLVN